MDLSEFRITLFSKQLQAYKILEDSTTTELCYGGAARGAKSWLGCTWQIIRRISMPMSAGLIAREELTKLRDTTILTFFKVLKTYRLENYGKYNAQDYTFKWFKGSITFFREIKYLPGDPEFDRLGSYDLTDCFLDEAQQISAKAISVLKGRFSLLEGDGWKTIPKALYTCNPRRNWIYNDFVSPSENRLLPVNKRFIKSLPIDNPYNTHDYLDNLLRADKVTVQRLYYGNFDYDDDPTALCDFDAIMNCFTNDHIKETGQKFLSADLAMQGRDKFIAGVWNGLIVNIKIDKAKATGKEIETDLKQLMINESIPHSKTVVDSDGLGNYLESYLNGIKQFHGGAKPSNAEFANLKTECGYKLAEIINRSQIKIICKDTQKEAIIQELGILKTDNIDKDTGKKYIISNCKLV